MAEDETYEAPAILTQDAILFPGMEVNMSMHEPRSIAAALQALQEHNLVVLIPSTDLDSAVGSIGTLALVRKMPSQGAGGSSLWKGLWRVKVDRVLSGEPYVRIRFSKAGETRDVPSGKSAIMSLVFGQIDEFVRVIPGIPTEIIEFLKGVDSPGKLADLCAYSPFFSRQDRLDLLNTLDPEERLVKVNQLLDEQLKNLKRTSGKATIPECSTCIELADRAFELGPARGAEVAAEFLTHVIREHPDEVLGLLAERYGPSFMRRRALK